MKKGFTLIEILIAISLLAIVFSIFYTVKVSFTKTTDRLKIKAEEDLQITNLLKMLNEGKIIKNGKNIVVLYNTKSYLFKGNKIFKEGKLYLTGIKMTILEKKKNYFKLLLDFKKINLKINILRKGVLYEK